MTPDAISAEIDAGYNDWSGHVVPHLTDLVPLAITKGIDADADLVFLAAIVDGHVCCGLVCGCSLMVGASVRWAVLRYDGDDGLLDQFKERAASELLTEGMLFCPLRGEDERWRSFRGELLLSFDERLARVRREMN